MCCTLTLWVVTDAILLFYLQSRSHYFIPSCPHFHLQFFSCCATHTDSLALSLSHSLTQSLTYSLLPSALFDPNQLLIEMFEQLQLNFSLAFHCPGTHSIHPFSLSPFISLSVLLSVFSLCWTLSYTIQQQLEHRGGGQTASAALHLVHEDYLAADARSDHAEDSRGARPEQLWLWAKGEVSTTIL